MRQFSLLFVKGDDNLYWFAQGLLLSHIETIVIKGDHNVFDAVKYIDMMPVMDKVDKILGFIWLRWATDGETDQRYLSDSTLWNRIEAKMWFGLEKVLEIRPL